MSTSNNTISPPNGSLLPTQSTIPVVFTYGPKGYISVDWKSDDGSLRFLKPTTSTDPDTGITGNELLYSGRTPQLEPTITLTDSSNNRVLLTVKYNFKYVRFVKNSISYPQGLQAIYPFGRQPDVIDNGVLLQVQAIDPQQPTQGIPNFHVSFSAAHNALSFFRTDGSQITADPLASDGGQQTLRYSTTTGPEGFARIIVLPTSPGIFSVEAGYGSDAQTASGRAVFLSDAPADPESALEKLQFPTGDGPDGSINFDESTGATFPVQADQVILQNPTPLTPTDPVVIVSYDDQDGPENGVVAGDIVTVSELVNPGIQVAKGKVPIGDFVSFYYMSSNGVAFWQSATVTVTSSGTEVTGPADIPGRLTMKPFLTNNPKSINEQAITGNMTIMNDAFLGAQMKMVTGVPYQYNIYLSGFKGNSSIPRYDYYSITGTVPRNSSQAIATLPEEWFADYGHNGNVVGQAQFELVSFPPDSDPMYSGILTLSMDTTG